MWAVMIAVTPASIAARNGSSASGRNVSTVGSSRCESSSVSPCPGKCLAQAATPPASSPATNAATWRATSSASEPNERTPMIGLSAVVFTSATGAKSRLMPAPARSACHRAGHGPRQLDVVDDAERPVSGIRAAFSSLEARHVAALLVDGDDELRPLGTQRVRQRTQLGRVAHVPRVEDDAAEPRLEQPTNPVRRLLAREAGQQAAQGEALELAGRHGVTP